jgi:nicotinamidase-related amidase
MEFHQEFLDRRDCILLLIDVQKVLLDLCIEQDRTVLNTGALIEACELFQVPILCTTQNAARLGGFLPELAGKISRPRIWDKLDFNCFENKEVAEAIRETGRSTLLIAGMEGHVCVFHTGIGALNQGHRVHIAYDAVTSRSASEKQIGLNRLDRAGAVISSTEMIIFELLHQAGTNEFKALLPLLKKLQSG